MRKSFQGKKYRIEQHSKGDLVEVWKAGKLVDGVAADVFEDLERYILQQQRRTVWLFRERAGYEETLVITFGSKPTVNELAEALTMSRSRHAWLEEDVPLVKGQMKTLITDGGIEFYSGEMFIEWDLRELEIPPTGEYQHYRHKLQPSGVKKVPNE